MAILSKEKYTPEKLDQLHDYLIRYKDMGQPVEYEINVDGFKAVRRTSNPDLFHLFESFVNAETKSIEVLLFTGTSNYNDKRIFTLQEEPRETGLSGIEIENKINEQVSKARRDWDFEQLQKDCEEWKEYAKELEEDIDKLEKEIEKLKDAQSPLHGILGEFGSSLVSGIVRQNPKLIDKIPALSGLVENSSQTSDGPAPGSDINFTATTEGAEDEESKKAVGFVNHLRHHFKGESFDKLMFIIDELGRDNSKIDKILEQLKG